MADAIVEIEGDDGGLGNEVDKLLASFETLGAKLASVFASANLAMAHSVDRAVEFGQSVSKIENVSSAFHAAAGAAEHLGKAAEVVLLGARALTFVPSFLGSWVPKLKGIADETIKISARFAVVTGAVSALSGRLGLVGAGFLALQLKAAGASGAMIALGTAGAYGLSKTVGAARAAANAIGSLRAAAANVGKGIASGIGGAFSGIRSALSSIPAIGPALALGPIAAGAAGAAGAFGLLKKAVSEASAVRGVQGNFQALLGGMGAARDRMTQLSKIATDTPFELPNFAMASMVLQKTAGGAMAMGSGLRLVGDVAAATGQPVEQMASQVGHLYDGLMNGGPVGGAMRRLEDLGVVSAATRERIEAMQHAGMKGGAVWSVAAADLMRFSGTMKAESLTWEGAMTGVHHAVTNLFRAMGEPIVTLLTPFLAELRDYLGGLIQWASKAGAIFAGWSAMLAQTFADGKLGTMAELALKIGFGKAVNFFLGTVLGGFAGLGEVLWGVFKGAGTLLLAAVKDTGTALGYGLKAAGEDFISLLLAGVAKLLEMMAKIPGLGDLSGAAGGAHKMSQEWAASGKVDDGKSSGSTMGAAWEDAKKQMSEGVQKGADAIRDTKSALGDYVDTSADEDSIKALGLAEGRRAGATITAAYKEGGKGGLPAPATPDETKDDADKDQGRSSAPAVGSLRRLGGGGFFDSTEHPMVTAAKAADRTTDEVKKQGEGIVKAIEKRGGGGANLVLA